MGRPYFSIASAQFLKVYGDGTLDHVAKTIGGKVRQNIDSGIFENACAIRLSYILNYSGYRIPASSLWPTVSGEDSYRYIFRVRDLLAFLAKQFGAPEQFSPSSSRELSRLKGILMFDVEGWNNATGHVTLWNGTTCLDRCYFPVAKAVRLWSLQ